MEENKNIDELSEKILDGIKKSSRKLVETSAVNDEDLVIADEKGNVQIVPAKELIHKLD